MTLETPSTTTLPIHKRGGQPGNSNALVHGFRSVQHPHPGLALVSPRILDSRSLVTDFIVQNNLHLLDELDHVLVMLVPRMFSASSSHEMLSWFRPILKLIRVKQRLIRSSFLLENPQHTIHFLARNAFGLAYLEFMERGLREFPIAPPADFEDYCADPSSTIHAFRNNSITPPSGQRVFVWQVFNKSAQITLSRGDIKSPSAMSVTRVTDVSSPKPVHSPFLTDQQWLRIADSYHQLKDRLDSDRKYKRGRRNLPDRLLFEAIFIKLAFGFTWKKLPGVINTIHPDIPYFPLRRCKSLYRDLYYSGFMQGVYRQLHRHFRDYGGTSIEELVDQGCFQIDNKSIYLAPGQPLTWQNFTALLLLQRAYHNHRVRQRKR